MSDQRASVIVAAILLATIAVIAIGTEMVRRRRGGATELVVTRPELQSAA